MVTQTAENIAHLLVCLIHNLGKSVTNKMIIFKVKLYLTKCCIISVSYIQNIQRSADSFKIVQLQIEEIRLQTAERRRQ
jgi:hypothetical protein